MFGFTKKLKLTQATDYRKLFQAGKRFNTKYFAIYSYPNQLGYPRLGLVIAKKVARSAVKRNRIKRVCRECFRLKQQTLSGIDIMVVAYKDIDTLAKAELRKQLESAWEKLGS